MPNLNDKKLKKRIVEWKSVRKDYVDSPLKPVKRQAGFIDEILSKYDKPPENHAIVESGNSNKVDVKKLENYKDFMVRFTSEEGNIYQCRGVRVKHTIHGQSVTGILTTAHIVPDDIVRTNNFGPANFTVTCGEKVYECNLKNTQLAKFACDQKCAKNVNTRVEGGDAVLIVDKRINDGKAASIGRAKEGQIAVFKCPKLATCGTLVFSKDVSVCETIGYVACSTDVDHGASGTPVFQWINNEPVVVAINKGRDDKHQDKSMVQLLGDLNVQLPQGSTGTALNHRSVKRRYRPGRRE
jgi:hypothetical protein